MPYVIARRYNVGARLQKSLCADNVEPIALSHTGVFTVDDGEIDRVIVAEAPQSPAYIFNCVLTYDIAEGERKGFFETDDRPYTHQFTRSYKEKAMGFMRQFLDCVEASNDNFSLEGWDNDPNDLAGKLVGIVVQREDYTNQAGEDRARMNVEAFAKTEDIRNNRFKLPEPKDSRTEKPASQQSEGGSVYDADLPF